jgi:hypothetical protein
MFIRTENTLKQFEAEYGKNPLMVDAVSELSVQLGNIHETLTDRSRTKVSAATLEKREAEQQMIEPCVELANSMSVIGFKRNIKDLMTLQGLSEHSLYRVSGNSALVIAKSVLDTARKNVGELLKYGIDENALDTLAAAIEAFRAVLTKPMDTIGERKLKTTNIRQMFACVDSIFYDQLDKLMVTYKKSSPDFYMKYRTSRNIIFHTGGKSKKTPAENETSSEPENL